MEEKYRAIEEQVKELVQQGKEVQAVALVHKTLGCGLKKAKMYVDGLRN